MTSQAKGRGFIEEIWSRRSGLNGRPAVYETVRRGLLKALIDAAIPLFIRASISGRLLLFVSAYRCSARFVIFLNTLITPARGGRFGKFPEGATSYYPPYLRYTEKKQPTPTTRHETRPTKDPPRNTNHVLRDACLVVGGSCDVVSPSRCIP